APVTMAARLREITTSLDPALRADEIFALDQFYRDDKTELHLVTTAVTLVTLSVLLLSAAGIYALMSVAVTQRRREIGIRSALGAHPRQIITSIFSRALRQLVIGVVVGIGLAVLFEVIQQGGIMDGQGAIVLPGISALMLAVGLLAAAGPARRALRVQPTEALRDG
ncbi:MAG TPA: FtsX-like permease family protein, partial [Longimicrobiaceae bacterium]|nr:FtsX-like permease family protein [Longimicrobiaceae bacterium]